jgi:hypothetical protein
MDLAESAGFFPAAFGQEPNPMLAGRPAGDLGPRYVIEYRVPGPNNTEDLIVQDVYPYATPAAVTYMEPGQTLFGTQATRGGWFAASSYSTRPLLAVLVEAGLPRTPPGPDDGSPFPWTAVGSLAAAAAALAIGGLTIVAMRRRLRPA